MARVLSLPHANFLKVVDSRELDDDEPQVDAETGLPGSLKAYVVSSDPKMTVIPHFFSEDECDHLIQLVEGCWMPSLVGGSTSSKVVEKEKLSDEDLQSSIQNTVGSTRTSWSCMLRYAQTEVVERLEHRVASIAGLPHGVGQMERMNMVRYAPGEHFNEHHDGKFRPKTIFVYLNDLPDDAEKGDTFFPVLGFSFKPRRGTAVMWLNGTPDCTKEDSRMVHAGRAPSKGVKYGVNCFTNEKVMRELVPMPSSKHTLDSAAVQRVRDLADGSPQLDKDGNPVMNLYQVVPDPKLLAIANLLSLEEVQELLGMAGDAPAQPEATGPFRQGSQTIAQLEFAATPTVAKLELVMCNVAKEPVDNLAKLRIVRPSMTEGLGNRGCGRYSIYVSLNGEEVFFPYLGIRFLLEAGDALHMVNVNFATGVAREDLRSLRVHRQTGDAALIGVEGYFHDNPLRAQQKVRKFVSDADVQSLTKISVVSGYEGASVPVMGDLPCDK